MKRLLKYFTITIILIAGWSGFIFLGTMNGWFHKPIANDNTDRAFINAAQDEINKQFTGNFAMAIMKDGIVSDEMFHSFGKPVNRHTVFQVSSLSKWVSAFGVLTLVEEGKLDLDAPVSTYLTRWALPESEFDHNGVTVRRILSHTAGFTDGLGYSGFEPGVPIQSIEESLNNALDADKGVNGATRVGVEPGSKFIYSGGGYTLLQLLVEEVSGQSFNSYMKQSVFEPLGMLHSTFVWDDSLGFDLAEFFNSDSSMAVNYRYTSLAATSLYTSLGDMELFFQAFLKGKNSEQVGRNVLMPKTVRMMREPHASSMGADIWGLGTILFAPLGDGDFIIGHDGKSTPPINTAVRLNPKTGDGIIVLETGHPILATKLASEWVFLKTGQVDILLFSMLTDEMIITIFIGCAVIVMVVVTIGVIRRNRASSF